MTLLKGHWQLILIVGLVVALWTTPVVLPLKILVVFLHELAHGLAALLTGGSVVSLTVTPDQGGLAVTRGGSRFLILTAGYLGSLLLGVILFLVALRTNADRLMVAVLGGTMLLVALLYLREPFALAFSLGTGLALLAAAKWLGIRANDLILRVIGLASMIYVPLDIFSDTIQRSHLRSDARMLAEHVGGPTLFWGGLWLVISLVVIAASLRYGLGRVSNIDFRARPPEV